MPQYRPICTPPLRATLERFPLALAVAAVESSFVLGVTGLKSQGPAGDRLVTGGVDGSMWRKSSIIFILHDFSHKTRYFSHKIR